MTAYYTYEQVYYQDLLVLTAWSIFSMAIHVSEMLSAARLTTSYYAPSRSAEHAKSSCAPPNQYIVHYQSVHQYRTTFHNTGPWCTTQVGVAQHSPVREVVHNVALTNPRLVYVQQGSKLLGFQLSGTPKNGDRNPVLGTGFPTGNPGIVRPTKALNLGWQM